MQSISKFVAAIIVSTSAAWAQGPAISATPLYGDVGLACSITLVATGGAPPYNNWTVTGGSLPAGLMLNSFTGVISGTPSLASDGVSFSVTTQDSQGVSSPVQTLTFVIGPPLQISDPGAVPVGIVGVHYPPGTLYNPALFTSTGGSGQNSWSAVDLPSGMAITPQGTPAMEAFLTGIPGAGSQGTYNPQFTVKDAAGGTASVTLSLTISATENPPLQITTPSALPVWEVGSQYYRQPLTATGGYAPYHWSLVSGTLPFNLFLDAYNGFLQWNGTTPTASGTPAPFTLSVTDFAGFTTSQTFSLNALPEVTIAAATIPSGRVGVPYSQAPFSASNGLPPYTWALDPQTPIPGLAVSSSGTLSGTPTTAGTATFNVQAKDSLVPYGVIVSRSFTMTIAAGVIISQSTLAPLVQGVFSTQSLASLLSGGTSPYTWSLVSGSLPPGMTLSTAGVISGTPAAAGNYSFSVRVVDSTSLSSTQAFAINVIANTPLSIVTTTLPSGTTSVPYQQFLTANDGPFVYEYYQYNWTLISGSLPPGLNLVANGTIAGTPTAIGSFSFTVRVTDPQSRTATQALSITVVNGGPLTITTTGLPAGSLGPTYNYTQSLNATGGSPPYNWSIVSGVLPPGLSISASGSLTGSFTALGTYTFTVRVTDSVAASATRTFAVSVANPLQVITNTFLPSGNIGIPYSQALSATGGTPPYSWSLGNPSADQLPPGLSLSTAGVLSGTPTSSGTRTFLAQVTDANSITSGAILTLFISSPNCTYTLSSPAASFAASGGNGSVSVTTTADCSWSVYNPPPWVTITSGASGLGNGTVNYTVAPNKTTTVLSAMFNIASFTFTIQEQPAGGPTFVGSMPHLAAEGGWSTIFTFVNKGTTSAETDLAMFDNNGSPLMLPLTMPQAGASTTAASASQTVAPNASFIVQATGPADVNYREGSAQLSATDNLDGFAIFHYDPTHQEAVVPMESRNAASYLLAFDNTNGVSTGVAVENVAASVASVPVVIRDDSGAIVTSGTLAPLNSNGHISFVLATQFPQTVGKRGTIELDTPSGGQISALGIRYTPTGTLTTIPALANVANTGGSMAHLTVGNGWQTTFVLINAGAAAASTTLKFFDDTGAALPVGLAFPQTSTALAAPASAYTQSIAPGASLWIVATGLAGFTSTGSAKFTSTGNIGGFAIFQYTNGQEAVVPMENRTPSSYIIPFDNAEGTATGIALANASASGVSIPVTLRDDAGNALAANSIQLNANGHASFVLSQSFPQANGIRGTVEFGVPNGAFISVLGIRSPPALTFTTLPALAK